MKQKLEDREICLWRKRMWKLGNYIFVAVWGNIFLYNVLDLFLLLFYGKTREKWSFIIIIQTEECPTPTPTKSRTNIRNTSKPIIFFITYPNYISSISLLPFFLIFFTIATYYYLGENFLLFSHLLSLTSLWHITFASKVWMRAHFLW